MNKSIKISLIIIALAVLAFVVWLVSRPDETNKTVAASESETSSVPSFEVHVEKPHMDRPFGGILPTKLEAKIFGGELRFDQASGGARIGSVRSDRLELSADGWDLLIESDSEGRVAAGTRLIFPIEIAGVQWSLRCRPADRAVGYLHATTRPLMSQSKSSDVLDGDFLVELAKCEDSKTGKTLDTEAGGNPGQAWPSSPLTLRGNFAGLPQGRR